MRPAASAMLCVIVVVTAAGLSACGSGDDDGDSPRCSLQLVYESATPSDDVIVVAYRAALTSECERLVMNSSGALRLQLEVTAAPSPGNVRALTFGAERHLALGADVAPLAQGSVRYVRDFRVPVTSDSDRAWVLPWSTSVAEVVATVALPAGTGVDLYPTAVGITLSGID